MRNTPVGEGVFAPRRSAQETKAETTTRIAREVIDAETASREAKTAKLREARLAMEALEASAGEAKKPARKRVARPARSAG